MARRKTSSCLTVGKPPCGRSPAVSRTRYYMVLRYAQKRLRRSRGKDTRTTLPPICGSFHSHFLLQSLPTPTSAYSGREVFVASLLTHCLISHPQPPMSLGSSATAASVALNLSRKCEHLRFSAHY